MSKRTVVPFGPQHPVLPEPIHLDLVVEDEKVVNAIPRIGYIHRGLEKLVEKRDYTQFVYVAERILVLTNKPTNIKKEIVVDLPRPRDTVSDDFIRIRKQVTELIRWW